ncbi:hypothetical protein Tco_0134889 [Tanacetum coccineum]
MLHYFERLSFLSLKSFSFPEPLNVIVIRCGINIATTCFTVLCDMLRVSKKEMVLLALKVWILRKIHFDNSLSSFITVAKGGSSSIFTFFNLPAGAELVLEAEELLLPLARAEEGSFIMIPFKVSALNVDFNFKIDLIVFGPETGSTPVNFSSGRRWCYRLKIHPLNHNQSPKSQRQQRNDSVMSDSDESGITYTEVSSPFEDLSDIGSPRADDHEYLELSEMLEDPYVEAALQALPSPDYVHGLEEPEQAPPSLDYDDDDDDMDIEADDEEEEHLAPADSVVVALPATDQALSAEETEPFETNECAATPPPHPAYRVTAKISIPVLVPTPLWSDAEVAKLLAISTPPSSLLSPWSSPLPHIPSPSLPLSPPSPVLSPTPPPSPIRSLGYRAAMIRMRAEVASTSYSLPLSPPFILSPTRPDAPSLGIPPPLPISVPTSSPPLLLPSTSRREDIPEVTLPPRKRLGIVLGPGYEVGESSSAAAARPAGGLRADYGFVATMDREIRRDLKREIETEARLSREAWRRSMDASDLAPEEVMSPRTTVLAQMSKIRELHGVDRRRQAVISEMLKADQRRFVEMRELRTADHIR